MVPNMRLKQITNLSTALLVTACLALGGTLWWSEGALERPYLLMERYLALSQQFQQRIANNVQAYIVLKMASVNGSDEAMDSADLVSAQMRRDELEIASQVLGQIFRSYLLELQTAEGRSPFSPLP